MAHRVFICHSSKDKHIADAACAALEAQRIPCWIAPRDILAGVEYGEAIVEALSGCQIVLLIFSSAANGSAQVRREVERAVSKEKIIVPFRIENVMPSNAMEYALSNTHWLDALTPPMEAALAELCGTMARLLQRQPGGGPAPSPVFAPAPAPAPPPGPEARPAPGTGQAPRPATAPRTGPDSGPAPGSAAPGAPGAHTPQSAAKSTPAWVWPGLAAAALVVAGAAVWVLRTPTPAPAPVSVANNPAAPAAAPVAAPVPGSDTAVPMTPPVATMRMPTPSTTTSPTSTLHRTPVQSAAATMRADADKAAERAEALLRGTNSRIDPRQMGQQADAYFDQKRFSEALPLYATLCDQSSGPGCNRLGVIYMNGLGVSKDAARAVSLFAKACGLDPRTCDNIGRAYVLGDSVAQNPSQAAGAFSKSCDAGAATGCVDLGELYMQGKGVPTDYSRAMRLFTKACDNKVTAACNDIGVLYYNGKGVPQNYRMAAAFYSRACDDNGPVACTNLGYLYLNGLGVGKDIRLATTLITKGCNLGSNWNGCAQYRR